MLRSRLISVVAPLLSSWLLLSTALLAEEHGEARHGEAGEEEPKNRWALFVGVTDEEAESSFSLGFDYERRLTEVIGIGGFVDYAFGDIRTAVVGAALVVHLGRFELLAGPGLEDAIEPERDFLIRAGVLYAIPLNGTWELKPAFQVDFVEGEEVLVYGFLIGRGF